MGPPRASVSGSPRGEAPRIRNDVYRPHACTEREALERLVAEAELGEDRLSRVRIDFDASVHRRITLWVPDVVGQAQPPASGAAGQVTSTTDGPSTLGRASTASRWGRPT